MVNKYFSFRTFFMLQIFWVLPMAGCSIFTPMKDEEPTFRKTEYLGSDFRLDGYYHHTFPSSEPNGDSVKLTRILFFNRNGIYMFGGLPSPAELPALEESFRNGSFVKDVRKKPLFWGVFKVENAKLITEGWVNPNGPYLIVRDYSDIINDSTLVLTKYENRDGSGVKMANEVYHFQAFSPKPDSVVDFIP